MNVLRPLLPAPSTAASRRLAADDRVGALRGDWGDLSSLAMAGADHDLSDAVSVALDEYRRSERRAAVLGARLCSISVWNMLLDLFISAAAGRRLSVSALCIGSRTSSATALRYLALLQENGLVERSLDASDARRSHVRLTDRGYATMLELLKP